MEEINIDNKKPLWWVILVIFFVVFIYSIGTSLEINYYTDDVIPNLVKN